MDFTRRGALLALAVLSLGGPSVAGQLPGPTTFNPTAQAFEFGRPRGSAIDRLRQLEAALRAARQQFETRQAQVRAGVAGVDGIAPLEAEIQQLEISLQATKRDAEREALQQMLRRPVDVEFQDATLRQAAQALSRAADLRINIDERAPVDVRFRVTAQRIPVWNLLGTLASQTNLMIAPDIEKGGVRLEPWPTLEINGQKQVFVGNLAPWSNDWGNVPEAYAAPAPGVPLPGPALVPVQVDPATGLLPGVGQPIAPGTAPDPNPAAGTPVPGGIPGLSDLPILGRLFNTAPAGGGITVVSDRLLIIAEPGTGPRGESGLWLTLYTIEMGRSLKKGTTTFHPSAAAAAAAKRQPPATLPAPTPLPEGPAPALGTPYPALPPGVTPVAPPSTVTPELAPPSPVAPSPTRPRQGEGIGDRG